MNRYNKWEQRIPACYVVINGTAYWADSRDLMGAPVMDDDSIDWDLASKIDWWSGYGESVGQPYDTVLALAYLIPNEGV